MSSVDQRVSPATSGIAPGRLLRSFPSVLSIVVVGFASLCAAYLVTHGRTHLAVAAIVAAPLGVFLLGRASRGLLLATLLVLLVPFTYTLGLRQASVPRVGAFLALMAVAIAAYEGRERMRLAAVDLAVAAFVGLGLVSWQLATHPPHSLRATVNFLIPFAFYVAARRFARGESEAIRWVLLAGGAIGSLTLYYEFFVTHQPLWVDRAAYYWNSGGSFIFRPGGVFGSPPGAATILAMTSLCGLPLAWDTAGRRRLAARVCLALSIGALALTFTRGPFIAFVAGLIVYVLLLRPASWGRLVFGTAVVGLLLALVVLPRISSAAWYQKGVLRGGTLAARQSYWALSWPLITNSREHLLLGHGINSLVVGRPELPGTIDPDIATVPTLSIRGPHNQYVRTLLEEGLVGLGLLLAWLLGAGAMGARAAWRATTTVRPFLAAGTAALASVAIGGLVDDVLRHPPTFAVVAVITGMVVSRSQPAATVGMSLG
jgi:O-antigen ligase